MNDRDVYRELSSLLHRYLQPLGMVTERGPQRAMGELVRGILFTASVHLSNTARLLATEPRPVRRHIERLGHHLANRNWDHGEWAAAVLHHVCSDIEDDDLIPVDGTELAKPYARRMQYVATVRDASRPGDPLVNGYWCFGVHHWQPEHRALAPLMLRPWSTRQPQFRSENDLTERFLWSLRQATAGRGTWLLDRGGDRPEILAALLRMQERWIVRLREDRGLIGPDGTRRSAGEWATFARSNRAERGGAVTLPVRLPTHDVRQLGDPRQLWLVVPMHDYGRPDKPERWVLLTCGRIDQRAGPRQIRHEYALRWRAEDAKRMLSQLWHIERFMVREFFAIERLLWCVCLAGGFVARLQREEPDLCTYLEGKVTHIRQDRKVPGYRIVHGIRAVSLRNMEQAPMFTNA
jgi:hypothetical protein